MKKHLTLILLCAATLCALHANADTKQVLNSKIKQSSSNKKKKEQKQLWFRFKNEPLVDIVNYLAKEKNINVVLPAGKNAITQKVTFQYPKKITLDHAWKHVLTLLRICGFTVVPHNSFYFITGADPKTSKDANKNPFPLYSHIQPEDLPKTDQKIRYIHYFSNIQVGTGGSTFGGGSNNGSITAILQALLSKDATIVAEPNINGVVITDYARNISSILDIINKLDTHGYTDAIEILSLKHSSAETVAGLFKNLINPGSSQTNNYQPNPTPSRTSQANYFSSKIRIIPEVRTNSLIVMGKQESIDRVKDFIKNNIDVPVESGESVLHVYDLQYLKASDFAKVLGDIVKSTGSNDDFTGQSLGKSGNKSGEQYFKDVIITTEKISDSGYNRFDNDIYFSGDSQGPPKPVQSSNRLIIAARKNDWIRIKKLIEELDRPQMQVAIEVLIVDLSLTSNKALGSQIRNKKGLNLKNTNFQTSHMGSLQLKGGPSPTQTAGDAESLLGNLLAKGDDNLAGKTTAGSLVLSFKDKATNGMWLISQILQNYSDTKILSQPFIVALNNQNSTFSQEDNRLDDGNATALEGGGGSFLDRHEVTAKLQVSITPLISSQGRINLSIDVDIEEFGTGLDKLNRHLTTNANINDGEVLVLGGLTRTKISNTNLETPLLSRVPFLGWLFKKKEKATTKDNLLIFFCPRVIQTRKDAFSDPFTNSKMTSINNILAKGDNFEALKDPITHWFFGKHDRETAEKRIQSFKRKDMYVSESTYNFDRYKTSARTITIDSQTPVDKKSITKSINNAPMPHSNTGEKKKVTQSTTLVQQQEKEVRLPHKKTTKPIKIAQNKKKKTVPVSEEEELKNLFSQLKKPTV